MELAERYVCVRGREWNKVVCLSLAVRDHNFLLGVSVKMTWEHTHCCPSKELIEGKHLNCKVLQFFSKCPLWWAYSDPHVMSSFCLSNIYMEMFVVCEILSMTFYQWGAVEMSLICSCFGIDVLVLAFIVRSTLGALLDVSFECSTCWWWLLMCH